MQQDTGINPACVPKQLPHMFGAITWLTQSKYSYNKVANCVDRAWCYDILEFKRIV